MPVTVTLCPRAGRAIEDMRQLIKIIEKQITYISAHENEVAGQMQRVKDQLEMLLVNMMAAVANLSQRTLQGVGYPQWEGVYREMRHIYRQCNDIIMDVGCCTLGSSESRKISEDDLKRVKDELGQVEDEEWLPY